MPRDAPEQPDRPPQALVDRRRSSAPSREFKDDNLTDWAAALTYYAVLSLFPALIALVSIVGLVADPATITRVLTDTVRRSARQSAVDTFKGPIESITANQGRAGIGLIIGLAGALWTASGYVGAFMRASNAIYESRGGPPVLQAAPAAAARHAGARAAARDRRPRR